jgi:hypothetical protein
LKCCTVFWVNPSRILLTFAARDRLRKIANFVGVTEDEQLNIEKEGNEVLDIIHEYYTKAVPTESNSLRFQLPGELRSFEFICPVRRFRIDILNTISLGMKIGNWQTGE